MVQIRNYIVDEEQLSFTNLKRLQSALVKAVNVLKETEAEELKAIKMALYIVDTEIYARDAKACQATSDLLVTMAAIGAKKVADGTNCALVPTANKADDDDDELF